MQTNFTAEQLSLPRIGAANQILRKCVHCGFCTATCPTYVLLGDELDSPRGRIYLIKNMLESGAPADAKTVKHLDRCLSCLSCMTTCPSGVHYMHLVDEARAHVEETYTRPLPERLLRGVLAYTMPRPRLFRLSLIGAKLASPLAPVAKSLGATRIAALLGLVPKRLPTPEPIGQPGTFPAQGQKKGRVALLMGCVQSVLEPGINAATIRLLNRLGYEVVVRGEEACCGSLTHHMGQEQDALARARRSIDQWTKADVDAVIVTASGCGTTIKDYGHMLRHDAAYAEKAKAISAKAKDVTEFLIAQDLPAAQGGLRLAYHSACSMQHGQKIRTEPQRLLRRAGFTVMEVPEGHLCCGSAGTYNILQPELASKLRDRKVANIESLSPEAIATGNIGCITQIGLGTGIPILHTVELLDWAYGGPKPARLPG
ncbi:MAG: glycolate oxidase subunit GlcF [Aestuariivirga sp.]|uniref:glycolate oxidase subunit GlcF n=1 Tax=Aestuariivirga sp. TaxID=2650926 RepID=UPI0025C507F5|nr:glycolate oxidase subunit GlcF [Aestuariivirga sp.]MCA3559614.1 glycolate oxidase subunit GlcF [Aestuariivirga sp.]